MAPAQYPGCSGTRNLRDNLSDLRAQVAANRRGCQLVGELIESYGLEMVQAYMGYIQVCRLWGGKESHWLAWSEISYSLK